MYLKLITGPTMQAVLSGEYASGAAAMPKVDWDSEVAVLVDMGEQRTGGYGVTVAGVRQVAPGEVELLLDVRRPGRGEFVAQVITHPHTVARVPRAWLEGGATTIIARDKHGAELARQAVAL